MNAQQIAGLGAGDVEHAGGIERRKRRARRARSEQSHGGQRQIGIPAQEDFPIILHGDGPPARVALVVNQQNPIVAEGDIGRADRIEPDDEHLVIVVIPIDGADDEDFSVRSRGDVTHFHAGLTILTELHVELLK